MGNIQGIVGYTGVQLEAEAFNALGAAVANQAGGLLPGIFASGAAGSDIGPELATDLAQSQPNTWDPTPYAAAFASGAGGFDPKTKFLFKVSFRFIPDVQAEIAQLMGIPNNGQFAAQVTFTLKNIDLPKYRFEYEEVNYYNFRTQILRRIMHDELGFTMYDTTGNQALNFLNAYLQVLMPSTRQAYTTNFALWDHGFAFTQNPSQGSDPGSRAEAGVNGESINMFDQMIIDQYYLSREPSSNLRGSNIVQAIKANSFIFTNPKITRFELGEHDHERGSEPQMIACAFTYDTLYMRTGQQGSAVNANGPTMNDDILSNVLPTPIASPVLIGGGGGNPFLNAFASQAGRTIASSVTNIIAQSGLAARSPGGGSYTSAVYGALSAQVSRTIQSIGSVAPGISAATPPVLSDNSQNTGQASQIDPTNNIDVA
jgi:hypothetical protein